MSTAHSFKFASRVTPIVNCITNKHQQMLVRKKPMRIAYMKHKNTRTHTKQNKLVLVPTGDGLERERERKRYNIYMEKTEEWKI